MLKNKLLKLKKIKNDNQRPSLFPPKNDVSRMKNDVPEKIIMFLKSFVLIAPIKTPSNQKAKNEKRNIIYK